MNGRDPLSESPFSARCLMMGPDHGAVDHLTRVRDQPAFVQRLEDLLPQTGKCPAEELAIDG